MNHPTPSRFRPVGKQPSPLRVGVLRLAALSTPLVLLVACVGAPPVPELPAQFFPFENSRIHHYEGHLVHYREWPAVGRPRGSILMVHGLGGSTYSFRMVARPIASAGYNVVAVDLPGFGYSSRSRMTSFDSEFTVSLLWDVVASSTYSDSAGWYLLGHSMGGRSVTAMAAEPTESVAGVIYVAPAVVSDGPSRFLVRFPPGSWILRRYLDSRVLTYDGVENLLRAAYGRPPTDAEIRGHLEPLLIEGTVSSLAALVRNTRRFKASFSSIPSHTLILWGESDTYVPIDSAPQVVDAIPGSRLQIIRGAAHCPLETHADVCLNSILPFLYGGSR